MILLIQFYSITIINAQQWTVYNTINSGIPSNNIPTITIDKTGNKWIGSNSGIARFDNTVWSVYSSYSHTYWKNGIALDTNDLLWLAPNDGSNTVCKLNDSCYSHTDSLIFPNSAYWAYVLAIDTNNNIWLGGGPSSSGKILKFDGSNWTEYNSTSNIAFSIKIDDAQNIWIGSGGSLNKFDGNIWTQYLIPAIGNNPINSIAIDSNNTKWLATNNGLTKFDGTITTYNTSNSNIQSNYVRTVAIDVMGNKWVGTDYGLAKFDGTNWTIYTTSNSDLPSNNILSLATDVNGKIWIGTVDEGLVVFDASVIGIEENFNKINLSVSPNPFSTSTTIKITNQNQLIKNYNIKMYDVLGCIVKQMEVPATDFNITREDLPNGLYFIHILLGKKVIATEKLVITDF